MFMVLVKNVGKCNCLLVFDSKFLADIRECWLDIRECYCWCLMDVRSCLMENVSVGIWWRTLVFGRECWCLM